MGTARRTDSGMGVRPAPLVVLALATAACLARAAPPGSTPAAPAPQSAPPAAVAGFLANRCLDCHAGDTAEGGFDLTHLPPAGTDTATDRRWARIIERVETGEMPPAEAEAPDGPERHAFTTAAGDWLRTAIRRRDAAEGRVRGRQLAPRELERSLHALLGVDIPLATMIPVESRPAEYTTVAERQTVSVHRLESHLAVVDAALDEAFRRASTPSDETTCDFSAPDIARKDPTARCREPELLHGEAVVWANRTIYYGRLPVTTAPEDGWYRFRLTVRGLNLPATGGVWSTVSTGLCVSSAPLLQFVTAFEALAEPREIVFDAWLPQRHMLEIRPGDATLAQARFRSGQVGAGEGEPQQVPGIAMTRLTMERIHHGPDADGIRRLLGGDLPWERSAPMETLEDDGPLQPYSARPHQDLARLLGAFARRAFRRPVTKGEIAPIIALATAVLDEDALDRRALDGSRRFAAALRAGYRAILCSPRFFYFTESPGPLDDHARATRLSYFLTGGPPDQRLSTLADDGRLGDPTVLVAEADRLLAGTGGRRFVADFTAEWLDLDQIDFTEPDRKLYPEFDGVVKHAMLQETRAFLEAMLRDDRPVSELVSTDATYLDSRLARYYRIEGVTGDAVRRVDIPAEAHRGGLLAQGAILKVTANGSTTSPVVRGAWIAERLLGMEIPPPPAGVPAIEPDIRGTTTIRAQLAQHRSAAACASCHRLMDPLGFALEHFDPAGQWRMSYPTDPSRHEPPVCPVDAADVLADGTAFADFEEFRAALATRPEWLARGLAGHLLVYGTGGRLSFVDREAVAEIARRAADAGHGMRSILHAVVSHPIFLSK